MSDGIKSRSSERLRTLKMVIDKILDSGSIVQVYVLEKSPEIKEYRRIIFDHRSFWNMYKAEGGNLFGRDIKVEEIENQKVILFL